MKTNSIGDIGFQRKAKAVNGRKTHRKKLMEHYKLWTDTKKPIIKKIVFFGGETRAEF